MRSALSHRELLNFPGDEAEWATLLKLLQKQGVYQSTLHTVPEDVEDVVEEEESVDFDDDEAMGARVTHVQTMPQLYAMNSIDGDTKADDGVYGVKTVDALHMVLLRDRQTFKETKMFHQMSDTAINTTVVPMETAGAEALS